MIDEINKLYIEVQQGLIDGKVVDIGYLCSKTKLSDDAYMLLDMIPTLGTCSAMSKFNIDKQCFEYRIGRYKELNAVIKQAKSLAKKVVKASISYSYELGEKVDVLIKAPNGNITFKKMYVHQIERKEILTIGKEAKTQIKVTVGYKSTCGHTNLYTLRFHKPKIHK